MFKRLILISLISFTSLSSFSLARADSSIPPSQRLGTGIPTSLAASPDGKTLAVGSSIGVWLLNSTSLQPIGFWDTGFWVNTVEYSVDGKYVMANDKVLEAASGQLVNLEIGQLTWITDKCSPSGNLCAEFHRVDLSQPYDVTDSVRVIDTNTLIDVALVRQWNPQDIAWSPDNSNLYILSRGTYRQGPTVNIWSTNTWTKTTVLKDYFKNGSLCEWFGSTLFPCKPSTMRAWWHYIHIYDPGIGALIRRLEAHHLDLRAAKLNSDESLLVTSGFDAGRKCVDDVIYGTNVYWYGCDELDSSTKIWNFNSQTQIATLPTLFDDVVFSPDSRIIIGQTSIGYEAWDWKAGQKLWAVDSAVGASCNGGFYEEQSTTKCIAVSSDGRYWAAATDRDSNNVVQLRRTDTGEFIANFAGHTASVTEVLFSPDGSQLAASSLDGTILIWPVP